MRTSKNLTILTAGILMLIWGATISLADDLSTWRYGSPGDVRRYGNRLMQDTSYSRQHRNGNQTYGRDEAKAAYMDMMFRAGSPELYRYTQPQAPQVKIYMNNSGESSQYTIPSPQKRRAITTWKPKYPKALVP
jgi:hypothetical protein